MDNNKVVKAFVKVRSDINAINSEIEKLKTSKPKASESKIDTSNIESSIKRLEKSIITIQNDHSEGFEKLQKIISKLEETFENKLQEEIEIIKSEIEEKIGDIEQKNSYVDGEDLY